MMDILLTLVFMFFPMVIWIGVVSVIVRVVKGSFRRTTAGRSTQDRRRRNSNYSGQRPSPKNDIFEMKPTRENRKTTARGKDDLETYAARGRKKDFVGGYNKKYTSPQSYRRAKGMQYSHTYNGHEPWDKCLPKELDPWDEDFYV